ncbi:MAG TPA: response regulator [Gemmatimonadaceae bacterium]|nr:response regulator [Gemmatimonadaceae bacterium]
MSYLLFADDNEDMRLMVRDLLQSSGHEVALAPDGLSALAAVQAREPDLLILDLAMPGMTGFEVCRAIKRNPFTSRIPVLMLTSHGEVESKLEGFEAGADDYLPKPFDPRELRARVSALLRLVQREGDRNPTSGLPGGHAIENELERRVARGQPFAVLYLDFDNFKPFADLFGFSVADRVIREFGVALTEAADSVPGRFDANFVGHIGGDDFLVITDQEEGEAIAREAARRLRDVMGRAVGSEALALGAFSGPGRDGQVRLFPLARLSTAILLVRPERWVSTSHLGTQAADVKRRAKARGAGTILVEEV